MFYQKVPSSFVEILARMFWNICGYSKIYICSCFVPEIHKSCDKSKLFTDIFSRISVQNTPVFLTLLYLRTYVKQFENFRFCRQLDLRSLYSFRSRIDHFPTSKSVGYHHTTMYAFFTTYILSDRLNQENLGFVV